MLAFAAKTPYHRAMTPEDITLAERLAEAAREAITPFYRAAFDSEMKDDASPVTEADRAAERAIRDILEMERPEDGIIGEEYGTIRGEASRQWVLDPIDGTVSFMAGRPIFGTLIALMQDGWPVMGLIDQPINNERWIGAAGRETLFNGAPAKTRRCRELSDAVLATTSPNLFASDHQAEHFMGLAAKTAHKKMIYGGDCYNYALLASGHIDIIAESGLKLHDLAALVPVVEGAGGHMCDWNGDPLTAQSAEDGGHVLAIGDQARVDDVLEALACHH